MPMCLMVTIFLCQPQGSIGWSQQMQYLASMYSPELLSLITLLVTQPPTAFILCGTLAGHAFDELNWAYSLGSRLDDCLAAEVGAGRAFHALLHLSIVVLKRPTSDLKSCCTLVGHWQLISLFSDYVLKQVDQYGKVILDYGHVRAEPEGE